MLRRQRVLCAHFSTHTHAMCAAALNAQSTKAFNVRAHKKTHQLVLLFSILSTQTLTKRIYARRRRRPRILCVCLCFCEDYIFVCMYKVQLHNGWWVDYIPFGGSFVDGGGVCDVMKFSWMHFVMAFLFMGLFVACIPYTHTHIYLYVGRCGVVVGGLCCIHAMVRL